MNRPGSGFDADRLLRCLERFPAASGYIVGYSGGADSTALLLALSELRDCVPAPVRAVHFDHGLHPSSNQWLSHCAQFCAARGMPLLAVRLQVPGDPDRSPELEARRARYAELGRLLERGEIYLTAHHADDRAETLFLNLMRGSGVDGIASIPSLRRLGAGWVARPLLDFTRAELLQYVQLHGAAWIDDPSNLDTSIDRNFLRHDLFPALDRRWPGAVRRLARTAQHARAISDALAADLTRRCGHVFLDPFTLDASALLQLPRELQALLIRLWVRDRDLPPPPGTRLTEFLDQLESTAARRRAAALRWQEWQIRRHRDRLWLHRLPPPSMCPQKSWSGGQAVELGAGIGRLRVIGAEPDPGLHAGARRSGAGMQLAPAGPHRPLKDLLRELGIPPWLRNSVPVLYRRDEVLAVGDWLLSPAWRAWLEGHGAEYRWEPEDELLQKLRSDAGMAVIDRPGRVG